jgi:MFS family permease
LSAPTARTAARATAITMGLHGLCTIAMVAPSLLAPVAAADFGSDASRLGLVVGIIYAGVIPASLLSGAVLDRFGDLRAAQLSGCLCVAAMLLAALAGGIAALAGGHGLAQPALLAMAIALLLFAASAAQGLGYGMMNPIGAQILHRATPPEIRAFVFSVKQSAVPIGQMVAGIAVPVLLLLVAWEWVVLGVAALIAAYVIAMSWMRLDFPAPGVRRAAGHAGRRSRAAGIIAPAQTVWATPALRELALVGIFYSCNQLCMLSFLVSYLNLEVGLTLVLAGTLFSAAQVGAMVGRLSWGYVADRWVTPRTQLGVLGIVGGASGVLAAAFSTAWPVWLIGVVSVVYSATAVAWNGVYFAEITRHCAQSDVGRITGGMQVFMSLGAGAGPLLFSGLVGLLGWYYPGFAVFALPSLAMGLRLVLRDEGA